MSGMLDLANVLELLVDGLDDRPLPEQQLVMQTHQRVLHVPLEPGDQVYAVHEEALEEILADVSPVGEQLPEQLVREVTVFQWGAIIDIAWGQSPLHDLSLVIDDQVQLEAVEPAHRALAQGRQSPHRPVRAHTFDMTGDQRRGVYDGDASALAQGARLKEQQQVHPHLCLTLHETVVGDGMWELLTHMPADIVQVE